MKVKEAGRTSLLLIDLLCLVISFVIAGCVRFGVNGMEWRGSQYGLLIILLLLSDICIYFVRDYYNKFFKRGFGDEFLYTFQNGLLLAAMTVLILFLIHQGDKYSRAFFAYLFCFYVLVTFVGRQYLKIILLFYYKNSGSSKKMILLTTYDRVQDILKNLRQESDWEYAVSGLILADQDLRGVEMEGIPVIASKETMFETLRKAAVDEVFVSIPPGCSIEWELDELIEELEMMGVTVRLNIMMFGLRVREKTVTEFGGYHVLTFTAHVFNRGAMVLKRFMDIMGASVGLIFTALVTLIVAPVILLESPGPLMFSQVRIGKNGRRFKIYKFRSMYQDAEARKKDLEEQNEMQGLMFKMKDDPRITKVGKIIRKTSIDEMPQFWNVLKGDMSLVGTRPPTVDEFMQYEGRHKRRLQMKPGITGLWQVSGRSDVENFEDVVRMDLDYIDNWSILTDVKLLVKTVVVVLFRVGAE